MKKETKEKVQVYLSYDPGRWGVILVEGPEVSEIKWDDGKRQYVPNGQIQQRKSSGPKK